MPSVIFRRTNCATLLSPRGPSLALRAIHLVPRLRKLTHMCSRTISGTAYRFRHGSTLCSPTVEKILCRSLFSKRSHIGNLRQIRKQGKGRSSKRKGNRRCPFLFAPAAGAATLPPSADGESPRCGSAPQNKNTADPQSAVFCFIPFRQGRKTRQAARYCPRYTQSRASTPCRCRSAPSA